MIPKQGGVQLVRRRTSRGSPVVTWSWCWKCSPWRIHWSADCFFLRCGCQTFLSLIPTFLSFLHRCVCFEIAPNGAVAFLIFRFNKVGMYSSSPWQGEWSVNINKQLCLSVPKQQPESPLKPGLPPQTAAPKIFSKPGLMFAQTIAFNPFETWIDLFKQQPPKSFQNTDWSLQIAVSNPFETWIDLPKQQPPPFKTPTDLFSFSTSPKCPFFL